MVVGVALGGLIGWERTIEDRYFGLRIHMLTSLAAAGFSVAALEAVGWAGLQNIEADPFRILQAVVSGLALLAAGTIIKGDGQVKGVTTGVGLWLAGAIGMAAGAGMYAVSVFIATLSFAILYGLRKRPQEGLSDGHQHAVDGEKLPKESES
ncbi:MAG TPA: MgtC/SapB family protein [Azoarcus taiwanensis]|nr:MgtC/SapB family protein [Azoarcus taiwanensis]